MMSSEGEGPRGRNRNLDEKNIKIMNLRSESPFEKERGVRRSKELILSPNAYQKQLNIKETQPGSSIRTIKNEQRGRGGMQPNIRCSFLSRSRSDKVTDEYPGNQ